MIKKLSDYPTIFGDICGSSFRSPAEIKKHIAKRVNNVSYLPFFVEKRHLKNVVRCMQLMDVMGLTVAGTHRKDIVRFIPKLSPLAKKMGYVDVITRSGRNFTGHCALAESILGYVNRRSKVLKNRTALIVVTDPSSASIIKKLNGIFKKSKALNVVVRSNSRRTSKSDDVEVISKNNFSRLFAQTTVGLLTASL